MLPERRLPMRKSREILRLHFESHLFPGQIDSICKVNHGSKEVEIDFSPGYHACQKWAFGHRPKRRNGASPASSEKRFRAPADWRTLRAKCWEVEFNERLG
jgi:hypothetical protein